MVFCVWHAHYDTFVYTEFRVSKSDVALFSHAHVEISHNKDQLIALFFTEHVILTSGIRYKQSLKQKS